tara:strand:- start:729 stop:2510 length:1782 start_codon:yes stop_codon:yes gene_type:complete
MWHEILKASYPNTTDVATDEIKDKLIQDVKNNQRKARPVKTAMKKIVEFDWPSTGLDEQMYSPIIARAKQVLTELEDEGRYRQRDINRDRVAQFINRYLEGEHQPLEDLVAGKNTQRAQTFENRRKFKNMIRQLNLKEKIYAYVRDNPSLHSSVVGQVLDFKPPSEMEPQTSPDRITAEKAIKFFKFTILDKQFSGKQRRELFPKTFENQPLKSITQKSTIRMPPALNYILDKEDFDLDSDDFNIEVKGTTQQAMAIRDLAFRKITDAGKEATKEIGVLGDEERRKKRAMSGTTSAEVPANVQEKFNELVEVQSGYRKTGSKAIPTVGRTRNLSKFFEEIENDEDKDGNPGKLKQNWNNWIKSFDVTGKSKVSSDKWNSLNDWQTIHYDPNRRDERRQADADIRSALPIGNLTSTKDVRNFFKDETRRAAFSNMKELNDGTRRATPDSTEILQDLFFRAGKMKDLLSMKYGDERSTVASLKLKTLFHLLKDEQYDINRLRVEDVIELLREIEYAYTGTNSLNMVMSNMRRQPTFSDGIDTLLKGVKENYDRIRKSFINAIKEVMVEESKTVGTPTKKWLEDEGGILNDNSETE